MDLKISLVDAAACLGKPKSWVADFLKEHLLDYSKVSNQLYFGHETAKKVFQFSFDPQVIVFQIVKGGTGKTSLVYECAVRASLYGARVLCIDMDQQGNLTDAFNQDPENLPVMIDILADNYPFREAIVPVAPGIDLFPSRFDNAMLDEVLRVKQCPIKAIYRDFWQPLKQDYDLILVDCPPSLGLSVAAAALAADCVVAPVTPEKFALSGLDILYNSLEELKEAFQVDLQFQIVLNKFEAGTTRSLNALEYLNHHLNYQDKMLRSPIRVSPEFPKANSKHGSIFNTLKSTIAKQDMDSFTRELLNINKMSTAEISGIEEIVGTTV